MEHVSSTSGVGRMVKRAKWFWLSCILCFLFSIGFAVALSGDSDMSCGLECLSSISSRVASSLSIMPSSTAPSTTLFTDPRWRDVQVDISSLERDDVVFDKVSYSQVDLSVLNVSFCSPECVFPIYVNFPAGVPEVQRPVVKVGTSLSVPYRLYNSNGDVLQDNVFKVQEGESKYLLKFIPVQGTFKFNVYYVINDQDLVTVDPYVVSQNRSYSKDCNGSVYCPSSSYPDTNNTELTDGLYASNWYLDSDWVGFGSSGSPFYVNVTINLGNTYLINAVNSTYLNGSASVRHPSSVEYYCGDSSYSFTSLGTGTLTGLNGTAMFPLGGLNASCSYLKTVAVRGGDYWIFMDEITVWGEESSSTTLIQDPGNINIAPKGRLMFNTTKIQMLSPDLSWSCCGVNAQGSWTCTGGECG